MTTQAIAIVKRPRPKGPRGEVAAARTETPLQSPKWLFIFVLAELAFQVALLFKSVSGARVIMRSGAFSGSLLLLFLLKGPRARHPAWPFAVLALVTMVLSIVNPTTNSAVAGVATVLLNLAILGPIFWVPRMRIDAGTLRKLLLLLWAFQTASAAAGVLQIYFPGRFDPAVASVMSEQYVEGLQITLGNGAHVPRPMGLTDTPGGAAVAAAYSVLFALAFLLERPRLVFRLVLLAGMVVACFTLYLSQVRSVVVMLAISSVAMIWAYGLRAGPVKALRIAGVAAFVAFVAFMLVTSVAHDAVTSRLSTLFEDDPQNVYYTNRGIFLEHTFVQLVPEYPLGAGLGRWGMIRQYFGDPSNTDSPMIWAEIQWTGWVLDGGAALILLYAGALAVAVRETFRVSKMDGSVGRDLQGWGILLVGYSVGVVALTFNNVPFNGTLGIDFWVLNAALFAAGSQARQAALAASPATPVAPAARGPLSRDRAPARAALRRSLPRP